MIVLDAHCDTITKLMRVNQELYENKVHTDIRRMKNYGGFIQFFAAWINPKAKKHPLHLCLQIIDTFVNQVQIYNQHVAFVTNYKQAMEAVMQHKVAAFLSIEGGEALEGDLSVLRMLHKLGVRSICLTWNGKNEIGYGVGCRKPNKGLTAFGLDVIKEMNRLGMLIDVSHLSPKGFWDVLLQSESPIMASHSNAKAICNHPRNLTNEQFSAIVRQGGVVGINLYPEFLHDSGSAGMDDIIRHIEHFMSLGGEDHIGLGSDFDGIDKTPSGIEGVQHLEKVFDRLLSLNYSQLQVKKIAGMNFLELIRNVMDNNH